MMKPSTSATLPVMVVVKRTASTRSAVPTVAKALAVAVPLAPPATRVESVSRSVSPIVLVMSADLTVAVAPVVSVESVRPARAAIAWPP